MRLLISFLTTLLVSATGWFYALRLEAINPVPPIQIESGETAISVSFASVERPKPKPPVPEPLEPVELEPEPEQEPLARVLPLLVDENRPEEPLGPPVEEPVNLLEPVIEQPSEPVNKSEPVEESEPVAESKPVAEPEPVVEPLPVFIVAEKTVTYNTPKSLGVQTVLRSEGNPQPMYPPMMAERGIEGKVVVQMTLDDTGAVAALIFIEKDSHDRFNREVERVLRQWKAAVIGFDREYLLTIHFVIVNGEPSVFPGATSK